jgi:Cu2+-containing amine oxidase
MAAHPLDPLSPTEYQRSVDAGDAEGHPYAHPISGLKIIFDLNSLEVLEIEDHHDCGLQSESRSARDFKWESQRTWKVINPEKWNRHGSNTAYKLVSGAAIPHLGHDQEK